MQHIDMDSWNKAKKTLDNLSSDYMQVIKDQSKAHPQDVLRIDREKGTYYKYDFKLDGYSANLEVSKYFDDRPDRARYVIFNNNENRCYTRNITGYPTQSYGLDL